MRKTDYRKTVYFIISLAFVLFALIGTIRFWCFYEPFYTSEHSKLQLYGKGIAEHIGISDEELEDLTHFTLSYLNDSKATLDRKMTIKGEMREVFTDDEKLHMEDVRDLNFAAARVCLACAIVFYLGVMYLIANRNEIGSFCRYSRKFFLALGGIFLALGAWIAIDFDSFWNFFHHIFFAGNDLWILDLRRDILIMIVPPEFFFHLVTVILLTFIAILVLYNIALYVLDRLVRENDKRRIV